MSKRNTYISIWYVERPDGSNELRRVQLITLKDVIELVKYQAKVEKFSITYGDETNYDFVVKFDDEYRYAFEEFDEAIENLVESHLQKGKCIAKFGKTLVHIDVYWDFDYAEIDALSTFGEGEDFDTLLSSLDEFSNRIGGTNGLMDEIDDIETFVTQCILPRKNKTTDNKE